MVIVTILARCLAHRNQCNVDRITDPTSQEYLARHRSLDKILSQEIETTLSTVSADLDPCNPTRLYIEMLAEAAILVLFTALSSVSEGAQDVFRAYEKRACKAAERIHSQAQRLSQLGLFKVSHDACSDMQVILIKAGPSVHASGAVYLCRVHALVQGFEPPRGGAVQGYLFVAAVLGICQQPCGYVASRASAESGEQRGYEAAGGP